MAQITYRDAGVDIDAGDALVDRIKPLAAATRIPEVLGGVGGFAGLCAVPEGVADPVLVSGTDGVGTKLKIAFITGKHDTIGIDLVAMCVNDVITTGARPLFFLDYFGTGRLALEVGEAVVRGIASACTESGCALLGGETAELPGMYADGEYDLAGFAVGVVSRSRIVDGRRVAAGDRVLGLRSSGLHSNGYSLARRVLLDEMKLSVDDSPEALGGQTLGDALLTPTRLYACAARAVIDGGVDVRAMCHVTGGGLPGNLPRVLPDGLGARLSSLPERSGLLTMLARHVEPAELARVFNLGVGYVFVVPAAETERVRSLLPGEDVLDLGVIEAMDPATPFEARVVLPEL